MLDPNGQVPRWFVEFCDQGRGLNVTPHAAAAVIGGLLCATLTLAALVSPTVRDLAHPATPHWTPNNLTPE
ncbi:MAG: hypothetical protein ACRDRS_20335 [Pseudonocardiaceae bacterium]